MTRKQKEDRLNSHCPACGDQLPQPKRGRPRLWCSERCRKSQYCGTCEDCGAPTSGTDGFDKAPKRCRVCRDNRNAERNEEIREMWNAGEPEWYIAEQLGLTGNAVRGFVQHRRKHHGEELLLHRARDRDCWDEILPLWRKGLTGAEIGDRIGMGANDVCARIQSMRLAGIDLPYRAESEVASLDEIEELRDAGLTWREVADELGYASEHVASNSYYKRRRAVPA